MAGMNVPHNINEPSESIIDKIETAVDFSDALKVPYTPDQFVTTAYNLIFDTGYFTNACIQWNHNLAASKTWSELKI